MIKWSQIVVKMKPKFQCSASSDFVEVGTEYSLKFLGGHDKS